MYLQLYSINLVYYTMCCDATITLHNIKCDNIWELRTLPNTLLVAHLHIIMNAQECRTLTATCIHIAWLTVYTTVHVQYQEY